MNVFVYAKIRGLIRIRRLNFTHLLIFTFFYANFDKKLQNMNFFFLKNFQLQSNLFLLYIKPSYESPKIESSIRLLLRIVNVWKLKQNQFLYLFSFNIFFITFFLGLIFYGFFLFAFSINVYFTRSITWLNKWSE